MTSALRPYTPSRESAADLDARTVGRDDVLKAVHQRLRSAATTKNRSHTLLVGPRGSGKSHVIEVALHRLRQDPALVDRLAVAKIAEDAVGVASYGDLLLELLRSLAPVDPFLADARARHDPLALERLVEDLLGDRVLVAVVENLDRLFAAIGTVGQQQFRAWVETSRAVVLLASTPLLFQAVGSRDEPWFGSFAVEHLDDLDLSQGRELLRQLAQARGDVELTALLDSQKGEARLAALHALSGGSPRVWVILGDCASVTGLDQLVPTVEQLLEDLVPYYQQRLWELPANEQRLVSELGRGPETATVKKLAAATGLNETTAGKTLNRLTEGRWVRAEKRVGTDQRTTWYRLREPMLRHHLQHRSTAGGPIHLLVLMLRAWFSPDERRRFLADAPACSRAEENLAATFALDPPRRGDGGYATQDIDELLTEARLWIAAQGGDRRSGAVLEVLIEAVREGVEAAMQLASTRGVGGDPLVAAAFKSSIGVGVATEKSALGQLLLIVADAAIGTISEGRLGLVAAGWCGIGDPRAAVDRLCRIVESEDEALMLTIKEEMAFWLFRCRRTDEAIRHIEAVIVTRTRLNGHGHRETLSSRHQHASMIGASGRSGEAVVLLAELVDDQVHSLGSVDRDTLSSRHSEAFWLVQSGRAAEGLTLIADVVADQARSLGWGDRDTLSSRHNQVCWLGESGRAGEALNLSAEVVAGRTMALGSGHPDTLKSLHNHAYMLGIEGNTAEALSVFRDMLLDAPESFGKELASLLSELLRQAIEGLPTERQRTFEEDIAAVISTAMSVLKGDAGIDHLPPELRAAFVHATAGAR